MDNTEKMDTYGFIVDYFEEEKIKSRYVWLYSLMQDYIDVEKLEGLVRISEDILNHVIIDYYVDIYRLKEFQDIETTHDSKVYAYLVSWLLRHKPIQILADDMEKVVFINERFATELLRSYLFRNPKNIPILSAQKEAVDNFLETLLYYFKYRDYSAKSIEMLILSFEAGRAYQFSADKAE